MTDSFIKSDQQNISLCEALDRILNKGAVIMADITLSVADVDLLYLSLQALVTSVETGKKLRTGGNDGNRI